MPKTQFLKAFNGQTFEIQMNQRTNDGNKLFKWKRGAAFTAKERGLWTQRDGITAEDIAHIKSRVELFRCTGEVQPRPGGVPMCQHCLAKWIRDGAAKHDARQVLPAPALQSNPGTVDGLQELLDAGNTGTSVCAPCTSGRNRCFGGRQRPGAQASGLGGAECMEHSQRIREEEDSKVYPSVNGCEGSTMDVGNVCLLGK